MPPRGGRRRLEAVVRRRALGTPRRDLGPVAVGGRSVRPDRFQAVAGDVSADLTRREFELIHLLGEREGQVLPREEIYERGRARHRRRPGGAGRH